jgi:hypothetical protein
MCVWDVGWFLGYFEICISPKYSSTRTIALVHALAKLHNFCIDKQEKRHSKEPVSIPDRLLQDEDYMMMQCSERYITMTTYDSGVSLPVGLMDCCQRSNDMPSWAVHRTWIISEDVDP